MDISHRIFELRKQTGLNQADFGKRIGVTRSAICNYENGSRSVSEQVILAICREFNVHEIWLRNGEGKMFVQRAGEEELAAAVERLITTETAEFRRRLIKALSALNDEHRILVGQKIVSSHDDASIVTPAHTPTIEDEARAEAEEYYRQILSEKEQAAKSPASGRGGSDTATG